MGGFSDIFSGVGNAMQTIGGWWVLLVALAVLVHLLRQLRASFRLVRRMREGTRHRGSRKAARTVAALALRHPASMFVFKNRFFAVVRRRVELEIFHPRPQWEWPLSEDHEAYEDFGGLDLRDLGPREARREEQRARKAAWASYRRKLAEWRDTVDSARRDLTIKIDNAGDLNDNLSRVKLYFDTVKVLSVDPYEHLQFLCPVKVRTGFIAAQHLLTGLLVRYNEKWEDIIRGFETHTRDTAGMALADDAALNFRQIQSFIYHCWLLWGPSVPICPTACGNWTAAYSALQYGFGDENNSIEIVGKADYLREQLDAVLKDSWKPGMMAVPASVSGRLKYSSIASLSEDTLPKALKVSWQGEQDERPILFLSRKQTVSADAPDGHESYDADGAMSAIATGAGDSRYYSAYFWIMLVTLRFEEGKWVPVQRAGRNDGGSAMLWKAALPFFEHGNMADAESCAFAKHQLAEKTLSGLAYLVESFGTEGEPFPHRFAYACAVDDPNCGTEPTLAVAQLAGGDKTVVQLMRERLDAEAALPVSRLAPLKELIDFDYYRRQPHAATHAHSACQLSADVDTHYKALDRERAAAAAG